MANKMMSGYIELHASSAMSFLRGASPPDALAAEAARLGLPALALLDRDGVYGAPRLYGAARTHGVRALVGAELTLEDGTALPLLASSQAGYRNLCRLITTAKLVPRDCVAKPAEGFGRSAPRASPHPDISLRSSRKRPAFATWEELAAHADGLIALTGDEEGPVLQAWQRGGAAPVAGVLDRLERIFGRDRLYVEVQRRRVRGEEPALRMLADAAAARGLPLLATGGVLHATREERPVSDLFCCLRNHTTLDRAGRLLAPNAERHLRTARSMRALFRSTPEAVDNSLRLAERLEFTLADLDYRFPDFPVPAGETMESFLRARAYEGAALRFGTVTAAARTQLDRELALIGKLGFAGYFLIVWDICRWCRERGILIQGRGSAANSTVCYALHITAVDPLKHRLLFERFLSEGRVGADGHPSWPDIDLDLPSGDLRESAIQEMFQRYGQRGAAMVANVITYRGRSSAREVGKALDLPEDVLDRFSSLYANGDFPETLDLHRQLEMSGLPRAHPRLAAMLHLCRRIRGLPRHLGQHSGGMVLCPGRLDQVVPIENASMPGRTVVQWDKDDCEDLGLVKIDLLGLGMMAVLQDCMKLCGERGRPFELHSVPHDDEPTFEMMRRADTIGVFQIESRAQMATLPRLLPRNFYDVAIEVAIVRPGPIVGKVSHPLLRRRAGQERLVCIDPSVDALARPILERTYGVVLFQEQMLSLAMTLGGFSGGEAEELRRALGFHRDEQRLLRSTAKLRDALRARGHNERVVEAVGEAALAFALYGFPESHAISFALLAYASTWLKVHRPAEFYASLLNQQPMGFYSPATLVQDGRRHGLRVRPVCVQGSEWECTVEADDTIRVGLRYVKGLREAGVRRMLEARRAAPFSSLDDFLRRTGFSAADRRALAAVGALNALVRHRRAALWQVEAAWSADEPLLTSAGHVGADSCSARTVWRSTSNRAEQDSAPTWETGTWTSGALAPMTLAERLQADFEGLSLTAGEHPMHLVRARLPDAWRAADLPLGRDGDRLVIAGSVICRQRPGTAKGVVFISLEDETGVANAIVSAELFERFRIVINAEPALRIAGRLQNERGVIHVQAESIAPLPFADLPLQASHDYH